MNSVTRDFTNATEMPIPLDDALIAAVGIFPIVEVWFAERKRGRPLEYKQVVAPVVEVDAPPPFTTLITVKWGGPATGFVVLK